MAERRRIAELHGATRELIEADSEAEILDVVVSTADRVLGAGITVVRKADTESGEFPIVARSERSRAILDDPSDYELGDGSPVSRAYQSGETVVESAAAGDAIRDPFTAVMYVPIGEYGVISVGYRSGSFSEADVELVAILAETITAALKRTERERTLRRLHTASRRLSRASSESEISEIAVETGRNLLGFPLATVLLYEESAGELVPVAKTDAVTGLIADLPPIEPGEGIIGRAYRTGEPQKHDDVREASDVINSETPIRSELALPLGDHGVIVFDSTEIEALDESDRMFARILAANVEAALDRNERDEQMREYVREIERKNERLETFASVLSHDLRNPLNVAHGYLDMVREEHDIEELERVTEAHERMDSLIEDVLTLAREGKDIGTLEPIPLSMAVERAWSSIAAPDAELVTGDLPVIHADDGRLRQLLENLFRNAVEHGEEDVTIRVGTLEGGFYVADDGPGVPTAIRERLRTRDTAVGSDEVGLGLQIVQTIVDAHGWSIDVIESQSGGARFEITDVEAIQD